MQRKSFIKSIFGASILTVIDGFLSKVNAMSTSNQKHNNSSEFASYGAIHLNNTSLEKSTFFWTKIVGMKLRETSATAAEFGTDTKTLVVVHQTAKVPFQKGYSGLYHFALHAPNMAAFATMAQRLIANKYPFSPVDHTMSKSIYLDDPDGINVEFTLETPERFVRVVTDRGLQIEDSEGAIKSASSYLDINEVLSHLKDTNIGKIIHEDTYIGKIIHEDTYIGHLHLYANNVQHSNLFYKKLGFSDFNYLPQFMYSDLGAGGKYQHRIAMNSWHGMNKPLAPVENAGMKHFQINIKNEEKLKLALNAISDYEVNDGGYWSYDPTGNKIVLTVA